MEITDNKRGDNFATITIYLKGENFPLGKIELTPRWQAAARSLSNGLSLDKDLKCVQVSAGYRNFAHGQDITFYYGKAVEKEVENGTEEKQDETFG